MLTRPHRRKLLAVGLTALWLGADTAQAASVPESRIIIKDFMFSPMTLTTSGGQGDLGQPG